MRNLFSTLGLALTVASLQPLAAQSVNEIAAGEFVKQVVPVMFDQVKTFSGLDVRSMLRGEPLYEVKEASPLYTVQLDSSYINLANVVKLVGASTDATQYLNVLTGLGMDVTKVPVYYTNHKPMAFRMLPLELKFPSTITTKTPLGDVVLQFDWTGDPDFLFGPLSSFCCDLKLTGNLKDLVLNTAGSSNDLSWLADTEVFSMQKEKQTNCVEYTLSLGQAARLAYAVSQDPTNLDKIDLSNVSALVTSLDMTDYATSKVVTKKTYLLYENTRTPALAKEIVYHNPTPTLLQAGSTVTTVYNPSNGTAKYVTKVDSKFGVDRDENSNFAYQINSLYRKDLLLGEWGSPTSIDSIRYQLGKGQIDPQNIVPGLIQSVFTAMQAGEVEDNTIWGIGHAVYMDDLQAYVPKEMMGLDLYRESPDSLTLSMHTMMPYINPNDNEVSYHPITELTMGFSKTGKGTSTSTMVNENSELTEEGRMFTLFFSSDLMHHVDNEQVAIADEMEIIIEGNQIRFTGAVNPVYAIYDILGRPQLVGIGDRVNIQGLTKGSIYIVRLSDGDKVSVKKFIK